jgi:hypothetical protein
MDCSDNAASASFARSATPRCWFAISVQRGRGNGFKGVAFGRLKARKNGTWLRRKIENIGVHRVRPFINAHRGGHARRYFQIRSSERREPVWFHDSVPGHHKLGSLPTFPRPRTLRFIPNLLPAGMRPIG